MAAWRRAIELSLEDADVEKLRLRRALYPLTWCSGSGSGTRRISFCEWRPAPAAMELEDGPRAAGASGRGGDLRGRCSIAGCCAQRLGIAVPSSF